MNQSLAVPLAAFMPAAVASGLFVSLFTLTAPPAAQGATGNPTGAFTNVPGVVGIACMDAPPSMARIQATEVKAVEEIMSKGLRHVLLSQYFSNAPNWSGEGCRAVVDGVTYDVLGAEVDSQSTQTRVDLQIVTV